MGGPKCPHVYPQDALCLLAMVVDNTLGCSLDTWSRGSLEPWLCWVVRNNP